MPPFELIISKYARMPSASGPKLPVGLLVSVITALTLICLSVTPGAVIGTFFLRSSALVVLVVAPLFGLVEDDCFYAPQFPHAAAISMPAAPITTTRIRICTPRWSPCFRLLTLTSYLPADKAG